MTSKKLSKSRWKKIVAGALATAAISGSGYFVLQYKNRSQSVPAYTVARIIDGDTFETTEKQLVRLTYLMAPELEYCGGPQAKAELEKLVLNKPVYFKTLFRDQYQRLNSLVYTSEEFVNQRLVEDGYAQYRLTGKSSPESVRMHLASEKARQEKRGIYSSKCTQQTNQLRPNCNIKGNVRDNSKYYHYPGCAQYDNTDVQLYLGDRWFCAKEEAQKAGFTLANFCP